MATLLKDYYSPEFIANLSKVLQRHIPDLELEEFEAQVFADHWDELELKQRMRRITEVLQANLPQHFPDAMPYLLAVMEDLERNPITESRFVYLFFPDYIQVYGPDFYDESIVAMERTTQFVSCEFAVRPFLVRYGEMMFAQMLAWAEHPSAQVRRLASEGMRPRLPWGLGVPALKMDPSPIIPILERLKLDDSEDVRRSVANNLNDISKDWPAVFLEIAARWSGSSPQTDALLKHASRTLLKQGNPEALEMFGLAADPALQLETFSLQTTEVRLGEAIEFSFSLRYNGDVARTVRLEYAIDFLRKDGSFWRKNFQISEIVVQPGETVQRTRRHSFRPITTRRYYLGSHGIAVVINGNVLAEASFLLTET